MSVGAGTVTPAPALMPDPSGATVLAGRRRAILLVGITLAAGMDAISGTALSIGQIDMLGDTHATPDEFAWLGIAYLTAKLTAFVFAAWLGARFGADRSLLAAILLLSLASLGSALTADIDALIAWRLLQGAAGGVLLAGGQTMLLQVFSRRRQPLVQAVFAIGAVMAPTTLAPALQGWIVDSLSWTWIFLLNLPLGAAATAAVALGLPAAPPATRKTTRLDGIGLTILAIAMICVVFLLQQGSRWNWFDAPRIVYVSLLGGAALGGFVIWETYRQGHNPLLDFSAFRNAGFAFGFVVSFVAGFALSGSAFLIPSFALSTLGFSATWAGLLLLPSGIMVGLGLLGAGVLVQYRGVPPFRLVPGGILLFMTAMWLLSGSTGESGPGDLMPALLLRGLGLGLLFVALTLVTLLGLKGDAIAHGAGLFNAGKQLGGLIGISALQTYLDHQAALNRGVLITHLTPGDPVFAERQAVLAQLLTSRSLDPESAAMAALGVIRHAVQTQVAVLSFDEAFLLVALLFVVAAPILIGFKLLLARKSGVEYAKEVKDLGKDPVVTFFHGWPLSSDAWDDEMLFLARNGFRLVAHDRHSHGRSSQPCPENDLAMPTISRPISRPRQETTHAHAIPLRGGVGDRFFDHCIGS